MLKKKNSLHTKTVNTSVRSLSHLGCIFVSLTLYTYNKYIYIKKEMRIKKEWERDGEIRKNLNKTKKKKIHMIWVNKKSTGSVKI